MTPKQALILLLGHVDYASGACRAKDPVGDILPDEIIMLCRQVLIESEEPNAAMLHPESTIT